MENKILPLNFESKFGYIPVHHAWSIESTLTVNAKLIPPFIKIVLLKICTPVRPRF